MFNKIEFSGGFAWQSNNQKYDSLFSGPNQEHSKHNLNALAQTASAKIKINDYFLRCSLINYDENAKEIMKSQNEKMFVSEYESDADMNTALDFVAYDTGVVTYDEPSVVTTTTYESEEIIEYNEPDVYADDVFVEEVVEEDVEMCADGGYPSPEGCCSGEVYTHVGNGEYVCCAQSTGECFPPMR